MHWGVSKRATMSQKPNCQSLVLLPLPKTNNSINKFEYHSTYKALPLHYSLICIKQTQKNIIQFHNLKMRSSRENKSEYFYIGSSSKNPKRKLGNLINPIEKFKIIMNFNSRCNTTSMYSNCSSS